MHTSVDVLVCPKCQGPYMFGESACRVCGKVGKADAQSPSMRFSVLRIACAVVVAVTLVAIGLVVYSNARDRCSGFWNYWKNWESSAGWAYGFPACDCMRSL
jgi:hypothetical protein